MFTMEVSRSIRFLMFRELVFYRSRWVVSKVHKCEHGLEFRNGRHTRNLRAPKVHTPLKGSDKWNWEHEEGPYQEKPSK